VLSFLYLFQAKVYRVIPDSIVILEGRLMLPSGFGRLLTHTHNLTLCDQFMSERSDIDLLD
jgi:hypothetical protein